MPPALDYAGPRLARPREPWGPVFVRPSRRTLLAAIAFALAVAWLALRPAAWTLSAAVAWPDDNRPYSDPTHFTFTPQGRLLTAAPRVARVWDPATGSQLAAFGHDPGALPNRRFLPLRGGAELLAIRTGAADLYDADTGRLVQTLPLPEEFGRLVSVSPSPVNRQFAALHATPEGFPSLLTRVWEVVVQEDAPARLNAVASFDCSADATFSPDGRLAFFNLSRSRTDAATPQPSGVYDLRTLEPVRTYPWPVGPDNPPVAFSADGSRIAFVSRSPATKWAVFDIRTGHVLSSGSATVGHDGVAFSADGRWLVGFRSANRRWRKRTPFLASHPFNVDVTDLVTGVTRTLPQTDAPPLSRPVFFPDNRRFLAPGPARVQPAGPVDNPGHLAIYDVGSTRPLSVIRLSAYPNYGPLQHVAISPDGQFIAAVRGPDWSPRPHLLFFRKTGRESPLGLMGLPQAWLAAALFAAVALSWRADARRFATPGAPRHALPLTGLSVSSVLCAAALPVALHAVLATASRLGPLANPGVVLLVCAIGLATGSRFWRVATLVALTSQILLNLYHLDQLRRASLAATTYFPLFDRAYPASNTAIFLPLAIVTVAAGLLIALLARRPAHHPGLPLMAL